MLVHGRPVLLLSGGCLLHASDGHSPARSVSERPMGRVRHTTNFEPYPADIPQRA